MNRHKVGGWLRENSLWLVSIGLYISSSGIDGAYMARWMPQGWGWLGLVLNTMSDVAATCLTYWFGRLQQDRSKRKRRLAWMLLVAEAVATAYSWFFSWRQLRIVLPAVEATDWEWVSWVAAGFIPLLNAFVGYAQALRVGRFESPPIAEAVAQVPVQPPVIAEGPAEKPKAEIADWRKLLPELRNNGKLSAADVAEIVQAAGFRPPSARTLASWAQMTRKDHADAE